MVFELSHQSSIKGTWSLQVAESARNFNNTILLGEMLQVFLLEDGYMLLRIIVLPGNGK